ncbi:MAG: SDR family oxidoreductase [Gammaproteobacteria bacterium]
MFRTNILKGKRILVTGGGTGLGRKMSEAFLSHGADVYICGRRPAVLEQAASEMMAEFGGHVHTQALDIRSAVDVDEYIGQIFSQGPLDGLVNNAAGNFISRTKDISPRGFDAIANIVFHGTFYMTHAVGKRWIEAGTGGSVLSILATWVWTGSPFVVASAMSKTGIHAMTKSLAVEWGGHNIRLNAIAPGPFPTEGAWARLQPDIGGDNAPQAEIHPNSKVAMARNGQMHELQNLATFLMADGCQYLTGQTIALDGAQYLVGGGTFSAMGAMSDDDWAAARDSIKNTDNKDKSARK